MCSLYDNVGKRIFLTPEKPHLYEYKHKYLVTKTFHLKSKSKFVLCRLSAAYWEEDKPNNVLLKLGENDAICWKEKSMFFPYRNFYKF